MTERFAILLLVVFSGCATFGAKPAPLEMAGGDVQKAKLSYRVSTKDLNAALSAAPVAAGAVGQLVAYQAAAAVLPGAATWPANATATVEVVYPHPDKKPGLAQVKVRVEVRPESKLAEDVEKVSRIMRWWRATKEELPGLKGAGWSQETWLMDVPQAELVDAMGQLRTSGFFESYSLPGGAKIDVDLDGTKTAKQWNRSAALDALVMRVRSEGRKVSSTKPPTKKKPSDDLAITRLPPVR